MRQIEITEEHIIFCDGLTCEPVRNWLIGAHCCDCPIIKLCNEYHNIATEEEFDLALAETFNINPKNQKQNA